MKIYVSGPITGHNEGNLPAFRDAAELLTDLGHHAVVPHDVPPHPHAGDCPRGYARPSASSGAVGANVHTSNACFIRGDLVAELRCDAIYLLTGWERSVGARLEFDVAALSGLEIYYEGLCDVPKVTL